MQYPSEETSQYDPPERIDQIGPGAGGAAVGGSFVGGGRFGGGGHKVAAGAIMPGPFDAAYERVTAAVNEAVLAADSSAS